MKRVFLLFGAPGCGKGYLGQCIQKELLFQKKVSEKQIKYISTGDLLRNEISSGSDLGQKIKQIVVSGKLVGDDIVQVLIQNVFKGEEEIFFLDGYPRTANQFQFFKKMLNWDENYLIAIKRDTPVNIILERVSKRRVCSLCGTTHSIDDNACPKCGGPSVIRKDDAMIDRRLVEYEVNTEALWGHLAMLARDSILVDGRKDAQKAAKAIVMIAYL